VALTPIFRRAPEMYLGLDEAPTRAPRSTAPADRPQVRHVANPCPEEPDAGILHVRICGSPGRVTARGHPATVDSGSGSVVRYRRRRSRFATSPSARLRGTVDCRPSTV